MNELWQARRKAGNPDLEIPNFSVLKNHQNVVALIAVKPNSKTTDYQQLVNVPHPAPQGEIKTIYISVNLSQLSISRQMIKIS